VQVSNYSVELMSSECTLDIKHDCTWHSCASWIAEWLSVFVKQGPVTDIWKSELKASLYAW